MGHIYALIIVVCFAVILTAKLFFSYLSATRHPLPKSATPVEIPSVGYRFTLPLRTAVLFTILALIVVTVIVICIVVFYEPSDPVRMVAYWMVFDLSFPATFIMLIAVAQAFRSYLHIYRDRVEYRTGFLTRTCNREQIELLCCTTEFIFIKRQNHRLPLIIENRFNNKQKVLTLLANLLP